MAAPRTSMAELDAAIAGLKEERAAAGARHGTGVVPIGEQVRAVARATGEAYDTLKAELEAALRDGRLVQEIEPQHIHETAWRDRDPRSFEDEAFRDLAASIEAMGQIAPVALRRRGEGAYEVVFGHRRVRACRALGRKVRAIVVTADDKELVRRMLAENALRRDLSPIEKARAWQLLIDEGGFSRQELAQILKVTPQQVSNVIGLASLPEALLALLGDWRHLSINEGRRLLSTYEAAGRRLPAGLDAGLKGDAKARARQLQQRLTAPVEENAFSRSPAGTVIRDRQGRKLARLSRAGAQLVLRFRPDLDPALIERLSARLPALIEELGRQ